MNHLRIILQYIRGIFIQAWDIYKERSRTQQVIIAIVALFILIVVGRSLTKKSVVTDDVVQKDRVVTLASVSDLSANTSPLPLIGTVSSVSEATIRAESGGKLSVYKKLGDYVAAGTVIAEFENSAERAAVLQAEGAYDGAKASKSLSGSNFTEGKAQALNTFSSAYSTFDDVIRTKTDGVFRSPDNAGDIKFLMSVPNAQLVSNIETERTSIEATLLARQIRNTNLTANDDLVTELTALRAEGDSIKAYLDDLASAYSKALPNDLINQAAIDAGKSAVALARTTMSGTLTQISATKSTLIAQSAQSEASGTVTSTSDAQLKQMLGNLNAAQSRLAKTIVRSPISGTINSLSVSNGDVVSNGGAIAVVSNNGALEIVAYITDEDAKQIAVGNKVNIDGGVAGVVTRIAAAIDPITRKIEVKVGIVGDGSKLINGQSVRVDVARLQKTASTLKTIKIPLSALKITPQGSFVFTVDTATSKLVSHEVKDGALMGDQIEILSGITPDMQIVVDARGLKAGTVVTVGK
jgi:HlyD family secretion protein